MGSNVIFTPLRIGPVTVKNRVYMTPHTLNYAEPIPNEPSLLLPSERHVHYYAERAKGGVGLIIVEGLVVHPSGDYPPFLTSTGYDERCIPTLSSIAKVIHDNGSTAFIEPWHTGLHATTERNFQRPLSSSPTPPIERFVTPKEMDQGEIDEIQRSFVKTVEFVKRAGFDGVDLHSTHGYLLNQFLSPFYNRRTDRYGGSLENRMRFVVETLEMIRSSVGPDLAVGLRLIGDEMMIGGLDNDAMGEIAQRLEATNLIDFLDVDIGNYHTWPLNSAPMHIEPSHQVEYVSGIKSAVKRIPVLGCVGRLTDLLEAGKFIEQGKMDMIGGARGFIAEPELVKKTQEGRLDEIITCIACNQYCIGRNMAGLSVHCVLNPVTGREKEWGLGTLETARTKKRIAVVGAGPAGMEAARILAMRNHDVTLYEKEGSLGGQLRLAQMLPGRGVIMSTIKWYENQLRRLPVKLVLGQTVTAAALQAGGFDAVVVATGSAYVRDGFSGFIARPIPGWEDAHVVTPEQYLEGKAELGRRVIILDEEGFVTSVGLAEMLADEGKEVELMTRWHHVGVALVNTSQMHLAYPRLLAKRVVMTPNHYIKSIDGKKVTVFNIFTNEEYIREVDGVIMITAKLPNSALYGEMKRAAREVYLVGDSASARGMGEAIYEGHELGRRL